MECTIHFHLQSNDLLLNIKLFVLATRTFYHCGAKSAHPHKSTTLLASQDTQHF